MIVPYPDLIAIKCSFQLLTTSDNTRNNILAALWLIKAAALIQIGISQI